MQEIQISMWEIQISMQEIRNPDKFAEHLLLSKDSGFSAASAAKPKPASSGRAKW